VLFRSPAEVADCDPDFKKATGENLVVIAPGEEKKVGGAAITAFQATDSGVGVVVKVDGLTILHAGDHALWDESLNKVYESALSAFAKMETDIAFIPLQPNHPNKTTIRNGALWAVGTLAPKVAFVMHLFGKYAEGEAFVKEAEKRKLASQVICPTQRGQCFLFEGGKAKEKKQEQEKNKEKEQK
jgi:L-ascorbate metabolism protein UlaG (beta-lactamase superfamily)